MFQSAQNDFLKAVREESCLDTTIPLGLPDNQKKTEFGPTIREYFADKFRRLGTYGTHHGLHLARGY